MWAVWGSVASSSSLADEDFTEVWMDDSGAAASVDVPAKGPSEEYDSPVAASSGPPVQGNFEVADLDDLWLSALAGTVGGESLMN